MKVMEQTEISRGHSKREEREERGAGEGVIAKPGSFRILVVTQLNRK